MQFNVAQLLKEPTGATRRYELNENLEGLDQDLRFLGPLVGAVQMLRTNSGILVTGQLSTALQVTCNRCLEPIAQPVRFQLEEQFHPLTEVFTGRYIRPEEYEGEEEDLEDAALMIDERHMLDLSEVVRQIIWLSLPIYPGCNWEGEGPCPNLTAQMTELVDAPEVAIYQDQDSSVQEHEVDPRWAALLKLQGEVDETQ